MKKLYTLLLIAVSTLSFGQTIYSENMGTPTGNTAVAAYASGTAPATFQNGSPIVYTGTTGANMMRVSTPSTGYTELWKRKCILKPNNKCRTRISN